MEHETALPLPAGYSDDDTYVADLLEFTSTSELFRWLCGGVHILDFFARSPTLYEWLLDAEWRDWFEPLDMDEIMEFVLRSDLSQFDRSVDELPTWMKRRPSPPASLVKYLTEIRRLSLNRQLSPENARLRAGQGGSLAKMPRSLSIGMEEKKVHEVEQFARYAQRLSERVSATCGRPITHFVDFGSGQNYLGRTMASAPLNKHVIAIEGRHENIESARRMDVSVNLAPKTGSWRNKKDFRRLVEQRAVNESREVKDILNEYLKAEKERRRAAWLSAKAEAAPEAVTDNRTRSTDVLPRLNAKVKAPSKAKLEPVAGGAGSVQYVEHRLEDGDLSKVVEEIVDHCPMPASEEPIVEKECKEHACTADVPALREPRTIEAAPRKSLMVMSIHSCGNLTHHGLRSIVLNSGVTAVAMVGCCYNLLTERLPPPMDHKLPSLRPRDRTARRGVDGPLDTHGFPMSRRLCEYGVVSGAANTRPAGIHFNVTARMMAVQAPLNWTPEYSAAFFTRHFYRALLQRVFLDRGIAEAAPPPPTTGGSCGEVRDMRDATAASTPGGESAGAGGQPIIVGSLRKAAFESFVTYVRAVVAKLSRPSNHHPSLAGTSLPALIEERMRGITDDEIRAYEAEYSLGKKHLSTVWTLMAYSAQLVEACIIIDRWLWLREQEDVGPGRCWVENVFDYTKSPRNMVVVGIKKP